MNRTNKAKFKKLWEDRKFSFDNIIRFIDRLVKEAKDKSATVKWQVDAQAVYEFELEIQKRYQIRFEEMHKYLNWIMDSSVMYDADHLKMAESAIEQNRRWATEARVILRRMMK